MLKEIKQFEVTTPDELREALACYVNNGERFAFVRVLDAKIVTRQFNFPRASREDIIAGLQLEASETLSILASDIEVSLQITGTDAQGVQGIFSAIPRHLLMEYLECFNGHPLIPVSLISSAVGAVNDFLIDVPLAGDNFCLVNFIKHQAVNIVIFANAKPTFFRELYDLSNNDFKDKIIDTIRYSCSHSSSKNVDHIYFIGELEGKDDLIKGLKQMENPAQASAVLFKEDALDLSGLNLWGNCVLGIRERSNLISCFSLIAVTSLLFVLFLAWQFVNGNDKLQDARSKFNISDYNRALELQEKVRLMNHV